MITIWIWEFHIFINMKCRDKKCSCCKVLILVLIFDYIFPIWHSLQFYILCFFTESLKIHKNFQLLSIFCIHILLNKANEQKKKLLTLHYSYYWLCITLTIEFALQLLLTLHYTYYWLGNINQSPSSIGDLCLKTVLWYYWYYCVGGMSFSLSLHN